MAQRPTKMGVNIDLQKTFILDAQIIFGPHVATSRLIHGECTGNSSKMT